MPRRQGQAPLPVKGLSNRSSQLPGGLRRLRPKEEVAEDFSGSQSKRESKMDLMTSGNPTCPRGWRWGHPHSTDSLTLPEDLFQLHYGVGELLLSLEVSTSWNPLLPTLGPSSRVRSGLDLVV